MRRVALVLLTLSFLSVTPRWAAAACAPLDPDALSFRQMIKQGTTGDDFYRRLILGRVVEIRDRGAVGGKAIAVIAVRAHPTGWVARSPKVRFYRPPPGVAVGENVEFHMGQRSAIVAHRRWDGKYWQDGFCGQTRRLTEEGLRTLVALARTHA